jgi:hypothetical protein
MSVTWLQGYNSPTGGDKLLALSQATITETVGGAAVPFDTALVSSETNFVSTPFMERIFASLNTDTASTSGFTRAYGGTSFDRGLAYPAPFAKAMKEYKNRLYLGNCLMNNSSVTTKYPSHVFYSNFPDNNTNLTWGLVVSSVGVTVAGSKLLSLPNMVNSSTAGDFVGQRIKPGDPVTITSPFVLNTFVQRVDSPYQITLRDSITTSSSAVVFWVGSNFFPVPSDNDFIVGMGENSDQLLIFKQFSLWRYNISSLQRVRDTPGTTSRKSIVNVGPYTFYFHGSNTKTRRTGIWMYDGSRGVLVSRSIQPYIDGISTSNYTSVVGWREGTRARMFVGDVTNAPRNISLTNVVISYDTENGGWSVDPIADIITSSTRYMDSGVEKWFIGTQDNQVLETPSGNTHNTTPISFRLQIGARYPSGSETVNEFTRLEIVARGGRGLVVKYKLFGVPSVSQLGADNDDTWSSLGDLERDVTLLNIPTRHYVAKGIDIDISDESGSVNSFAVEKISIFYVPKSKIESA